MNWLQVGDRITNFFNPQTKVRKSGSVLGMLNIGATITIDPQAISSHVVDFYSSLFRSQGDVNSGYDRVGYVILKLVTDDDNMTLTRRP